LNRRNFLGLTTSSGCALLVSELDVFARPSKPTFMNKNFQLKIMATDWGFPGTREQFCAAAKSEGYDGIEVWWPGEKKAQEELFAALKKHSLDLGFLCGSGEADPQEHLAKFKYNVSSAIGNTFQKPLYINCHSGRDHFTYEQNKLLIDFTIAIAKEKGIPVYHETHRSRMMFAANIAGQYIEKIPELQLTFDVSHWCNVHETMLADQQETVNLALQRVEHIHARIGHPQGPQVNDPRAPEWESVVKQHFDWWDVVAERKRKNGELMTILTEFGPPGYMPTLPFTNQPVADQWAINVYMMKLLRKRYGTLS
jgi:sugar phosphate isomerase/epimerase